MPLHLKYRPETFDDVIGNELTIKSIKAILQREDRPRTILLKGPPGCGKTTLARIIASSVNCDPKDVTEIDAGSERGVDSADKLKGIVKLRPRYGESTVFIIDEIHATSKKFQDSLLKMLEDGAPKFAYFILCTTDPEKILKTIISRSSVFSVSQLEPEELKKLVIKITEKENKVLPENIINKIINNCDGSPRRMLTILEQVMDLDVDSMEEAISISESEDLSMKMLCRTLLNGNQVSWPKIASIIRNIKSEPEVIRKAVINYCESVLLNSYGTPNVKLQASNIINSFENHFYSDRALLTNACFNSLFS